MQETLARASSAPDLTLEGGDLRARVFALMHALYVSDMRALHAEDGDEDEEGASGGPPLGPLQLRDLERALAQLNAEQRSVLLLVTLEGLSYEEVAGMLGVSVGTVIARLARARRRLRALLLAARKLTVVK